MDPTLKFIPAPGTPLFPVSPERANQQKQSLHELPTSPSIGNLNSSTHARASSDVQSKVAQFNSLQKSVPDRQQAQDAASLKRAVLAREQAESNAWMLARQLEESRLERTKVAEQLERVKEQFERVTGTQVLYEKEARRARKEAFKSSSALVGLQEELKSTRESLRQMQSSIEEERSKTEMQKKEAFAAKYQLVGVQEELTKMREAVKLAEVERDALKTSLREEEVARVAAEGRIALPINTEGDDEDHLASPQKKKTQTSIPASVQPPDHTLANDDEKVSRLEEELRWARRKVRDAEDQVDFMRMECRFRCCSCRLVEANGADCDLETSFMDEVITKQREMEEALTRRPSAEEPRRNLSSIAEGDDQAENNNTALEVAQETTSSETAKEIAFCPTTGTFHAIDSGTETTPVLEETNSLNDNDNCNDNSSAITPANEPSSLQQPQSHRTPSPHLLLPGETSLLSLLAAPIQPPQPAQAPSPSPSPPSSSSPRHRTITTTTTIPLAAEAAEGPSPAPHPHPPPSSLPADHHDESLLAGTSMTRQQAIEQIRLRRGRARSIAAGALTPRKQMLEGAAARRDISAPAIRGAGEVLESCD